MRSNLLGDYVVATFLAMTIGISGCSFAWKSQRERQMETDLEQLKGRLTEADRSRQDLLNQVDRLQADLNQLQDERAKEVERLTEEKGLAARRAAQEKGKENQELLMAQQQLAESLKKELGDARAKLAMTERGLVLTFLDEIFFDSGKAVVKPDGTETLEKVAVVLKETVPDSPIAVEGHTDNEPIKHSGWKSNWELSAARALAVLHYFVDSKGLESERLRAVGFGEFQPVASNDAPEGRRQNRRVEVVILPKTLKKEKAGELAKGEGAD